MQPAPTGRRSPTPIILTAIAVFLPMIAAQWWNPPSLPPFARQTLLALWGIGATLAAERTLHSPTWRETFRALGFVAAVTAQWRIVAICCGISLPMWLFLPLYARSQGIAANLRPDWLVILAGVILVNGIAEETLHRGFVFGNLRGNSNERSFAKAAALSALVFAAQHLYLIATLGWPAGLAAVLLAALLTFPLAFAFEQGGRSLLGPAILHTSSNAPALVFAMPQEFVLATLVPHMAVVLGSLYLIFAFRRVSRTGPSLVGTNPHNRS